MLSDHNIKTKFETSSNPCLVLLPDKPRFTIAEVNYLYLKAIGVAEDKIQGKGLFEAFSKYSGGIKNPKITDLRASLEQVLISRESHQAEITCYSMSSRDTKTVQERYCRVENVPVLNDTGEIDFIIHSVKDMMCQTRIDNNTGASGETQEKSEHFQALFEQNPDAVFSLDRRGNILNANKAAEELMEASVEELLKITFMPLIASKDRDRVFDHYLRAAEGEIQNYDCCLVTVKGNRRDVNVTNIPIVSCGEVVGVYGIAKDFTKQRKAERLLDKTYKLTNMGIWEVDLATKQVYWSAIIKDIFEVHPNFEPDLSTTINFFKAGKSRNTIIRVINRAIEEGRAYNEEVQIITFKGNKRWIRAVGEAEFEDGRCIRLYGSIQDIHNQRQAQERLSESLEQYDIVAKATSDTIWDLDLEKDVIQYNRNIYNMFGYKKSEVKGTGRWWRSKIHPEDWQETTNAIDEAVQRCTDRFQLEYRFQCADGRYKYIYDRAFLVTDENGKPTRMIGAMQDVTSSKEEEERLKLLESVITNTTESVIIMEAKSEDPLERKILYVNKAFTDMTGYAREEVVGKALQFLSKSGPNNTERLKLKEAIKRGEPCEAEFIDYKKSGEEFWIHISAVPVEDKKGGYSHWITVARDITTYKKLIEEIRESLREKEILLAEIHHRVKNNLAVVSGMMQLQAFEEQNEELQRRLLSSSGRIQTMATIHEQLYQSDSFSKLDFSENIQRLVSDIVETAQFQTQIETEFLLKPVELNVNQAIPCSLIVNEVVTNALKHAFINRRKGKVTVKLTENKKQIQLEITDDGIGLPQNFNFVNSNSLGLHLIDVLSKQLRAQEDYFSPGVGTRFTLRFKKSNIKGIGSSFVD